MKTILLPTNFSDLSINAFTYALAYAQKSNSKIIVFHSYESGAPVSDDLQNLYDAVEIESFKNKKDTFPPFEKIVDDNNIKNIKIKYIVKEGEFIESLKAYISKREDKIDMVIMGTKSSNHLKDLFVSNNTLKVLEEINKPVMAVPEKAFFDGELDNIVFLVDYKEDEREPLQDVIRKAHEFDAKLHVIHFDLAHSESVVPQMDAFKNSLKLANFHNTKFVSIDSIDLRESLLKYCQENQIDLVCLINYKRNFYQRLFTYSLSQELIDHMDVPVLAIYRD